jgi:hypothetical protein
MVLLIAALILGGVAGLPVGRWTEPITGLPSKKLAVAPTLGNGYLGLNIGCGYASPASIDLWLNSE